MVPKQRAPIPHPFLFVLFPIVSLYAYNIGQAHIGDVYRPVVVGLVGTGVLFGLLGLLTRDWPRAGLATSVLLLFFFSFGHTYKILAYQYAGRWFSALNVLMAIWVAAMILVLWAILRLLPRTVAGQSTVILNVMGAAALLFSSWNIAAFGVHNLLSGDAAPAAAQPAAEPVSASASQDGPDIYYIILDGFGRPDKLKELYNIDQLELIDYLKANGFYIAEAAYSNYMQTLLSLSSSLNMDYLDQLTSIHPQSTSRTALETLVSDNKTISYLARHGYRIVMISSGYNPAETRGEGVVVTADPPGSLSKFEYNLLNGSLALVYMDKLVPQLERAKIHNALDHLGQQAGDPGPKFVFVHLMLPHPPFLFNSLGEPVSYPDTGDGFGTTENYLKGYRDQVIYTSHIVTETLKQIQSRSKKPPVILVQGDHGPGAYLDYSSLENTCLPERFSILNAYSFQGKNPPELYPGISPVNTFRLVLNTYFGEHLPLLDDRSYYSTWDYPYQLTEVTGQLAGTCPAR